MKDSSQRLRDILQQASKNFEQLELTADSSRARVLAESLDSERPIRIVVVGEFNSGKSTLVNALCGANLLPAGIIPTTATINVVQHSSTPSIYAVLTDGNTKELPYASDTLQQFTARNGDQCAIREIRVGTPTIPRDLVLIDTPGVNDINQTRSEIVYEMIPEADALIFLMDIQQPLKRSEVDFLRDRILGTSVVKTIFVLNHCDRVSNAGEIRSAVEYVKENLSTIYKNLADSLSQAGSESFSSELRRYAADIPVFTVSAKQMLRSSAAGKEVEGDPDDFRSEILGLASPDIKMQTHHSGVVGQALGLLSKLRREVEQRCALEGAARDQVLAEVQKSKQMLRDTIDATKQALLKIDSRRDSLKNEAERAVEEAFRDAAAVLAARLDSCGPERGLQVIQQEIGRNLESRMEVLNEKIQRLATDCTQQASSCIPLRANPSIEIADSEPETRRSDWLSEVLNDPVNQIGFMVLAPVAAFLFGWVGLAVIALPFVGRLFGGASGLPIEKIQSQLVKSGEEVKLRIGAAVNERLDAISLVVLEVLDEPQQRIRSSCAVLNGNHCTQKAELERLRDSTIRLESEMSETTASLRVHHSSGLVGKLNTFGKSSLNRLRAAVVTGSH